MTRAKAIELAMKLRNKGVQCEIVPWERTAWTVRIMNWDRVHLLFSEYREQLRLFKKGE